LRTAVVVGTRPEIIKMAPIIRALRASRADFFVLHTGQHYSYNMDRVFFEDLRIPVPDLNLGVGSGSHAEETGKMLVGIEKTLLSEMATGVLAEGDTNTVLAAALAGAKLSVRVGHVEAGLRSGDMRMPEELNRIVADHVSDVLFPPTARARENLLKEGISRSKVFVTGNTIVDAVQQSLPLAERSDLAGVLDGVGTDYLLATVHRQENVDRPDRLKGVIRGMELAAEETGLTVVYPSHPRAVRAMKKSGVAPDPGRVKVVEPVGYLGFLKLERDARLILTDSGGVQEEACILRVPCVTLRDSTERPETVEVGANLVAGTEPRAIAKSAVKMLGRKRTWSNPFGDGRSGKRIVRLWLGREGP
jgi:UDP-N-acetylglucosamine 2-epimerase (non-hydrolysing)